MLECHIMSAFGKRLNSVKLVNCYRRPDYMTTADGFFFVNIFMFPLKDLKILETYRGFLLSSGFWIG